MGPRDAGPKGGRSVLERVPLVEAESGRNEWVTCSGQAESEQLVKRVLRGPSAGRAIRDVSTTGSIRAAPSFHDGRGEPSSLAIGPASAGNESCIPYIIGPSRAARASDHYKTFSRCSSRSCELFFSNISLSVACVLVI